MIISKTPLRLSFFCGGSDMPAFYKQEQGAALSVTIDKFIYVYNHNTPHTGIKTIYDSIDHVSGLKDMQDGITKECLSYFNIDSQISIGSITDIPSRGSGLGSSSAFTVGLIHTLMGNASNVVTAELAFNIEANMCGYSVGKQDQYAAAYGGFNLFEFHDTGYVKVEPIIQKHKELEKNLLLVYSGYGRSANEILKQQSDSMNNKEKFDLIKSNRDKAYTAIKYLNDKDYHSFGSLLHEAWLSKKQIVKEISNNYFDDIYQKAINAGALGGKLLGAGGGGFFIFYVTKEKRQNVIDAITINTECKVYNFNFCYEGSKIIYKD